MIYFLELYVISLTVKSKHLYMCTCRFVSYIYELCDKSEESMSILSLWFTFSVVDANEAYFTVLTSFCHNNWSSKTSALFVHIYVAAIIHCRGRYMCNVGIGLLLTFIKKNPLYSWHYVIRLLISNMFY